MIDLIPTCLTCGHEHSAAWTGERLTATGPCHCGCLIETRTNLGDWDNDRVWLSHTGGTWEWSDINGWVVDGMATLGGYDPDDHGPFTWVQP